MSGAPGRLGSKKIDSQLIPVSITPITVPSPRFGATTPPWPTQ